ncbi:cytochrome P450 [Daldinia decipiens]|uniref:cytochrome P450 n=1 Tax=Daldinia decipiens TaxID=326647 RepID=UPI0020C22102|nr:cytochrome P450 [Daldinia decipiens]KAI1653502.1 cytochrome P450 [Daldinia decipiens]
MISGAMLFQWILLSAGCILVAYFSLTFTYNVFLHPLRSYPGPLLAKMTDAYAGFYAMMMRLHLVTWEDHQKYGRVIRQGPNKLVFNSAQALKDIYMNDRLSKSRVYLTSLQATTGENAWSTIDKRTHRIRQRMIGSVLNDRSLQKFEPTIIREIDIFLGVVLSSYQGSQLLNMTDKFNYLMLDIIGQLAFGYANRTQTVPKNRFLSKGITVANYHINILLQYPYLAQSWLVSLIRHVTAYQQERNLDSLRKLIKKRKMQGVDAHYDLYHFVTRQMGTEDTENVELSELWSEAALFYVAGVETSSTTLCALFFYLSRYRECYDRLVAEIRSSFTSGDDIRRGAKLGGCHYLRACLDECMRISPPAPGIFWREASYDDSKASGPLVIDGHVINPGTHVGVCTYAIHHSEEYFPEPFIFKPERWMAESPAPKPSVPFAAFSLGARSCPGRSLAYLQISLTVAKTLWYFDFERPSGKLGNVGSRSGEGKPDEFQLYDILASTHTGPMLSFKPRGEYWKDLKAM